MTESSEDLLLEINRWVTKHYMGHSLKDYPTRDREIEHEPFQDLRSAEDYGRDLSDNISLGPIDSRLSKEGEYDL